MQPTVGASLPKQFLMRAHFNDSPSIQDDDSVRVLNGRESMGNHQGGSILHQIAQGELYDPFRLGVECRRRFIEDQEGRVTENGSSDRQTLPLAPESLRPRSPMIVSYPSGKRRIKSWA